ncbi:uncharacterized protein LOC131314085 [Rhododendron vialii]|uniref:uncharacterized protein LOC131314085 n=1 Tax=Rhododendron vialii TaxID=182163 RepID=UPI00265F348F|nr:uncharacterized protein LOC131314085 [Rhododendron vialii]
MEDLKAAPAKLDDYKAEVKDPLEDFNVGTGEDPRILHVCVALPDEMKDRLKYLLLEFKDCFAWDYPDMPGLNRSLVEHKIPIKEVFVPYQQIPRQMTPEVQKEVKKEMERLFKAKFIRPVKYVEWISNIVPVIKKNGKVRICIDFRNLNTASPKDEYHMPVVDHLVDATAGHRFLSFMDGYSGYNQIFIAEEDTHKTAFRCPGYIGLFEWIVMAFGLKNAGATYQRTMNVIFHDLIGRFMEVYIDDIVVKSHTFDEHIDYLRQVLVRMRLYKLKMNAMKCAFGVTAGNFLGFLVHKKGIEADKDKAKAIIEAQPPTNKQELQQFLGQVNFLRRFISNLSGKTLAFSLLLKLKSQKDFKWEGEHQKAFEFLKQSLVRPPVLMPPINGKPLKLYISAGHQSIGCLLAQDNENGHEQAIYYLSRRLNECEIKYKPIEKLCLTLYFSATKLRCYMLPSTVYVIAQTDIIKYMLTRPILRGKQGKWLLSLIEYDLQYMPQKAVKGQALADFITNHPNILIEKDEFEIHMVEIKPWKMSFDGSKTDRGVGAGVVFTSPKGEFLQFSFQLDENRILTNNQAEYEALIIGLEIAKELNIRYLNVAGDSQLVIRQITGEYKCNHPLLELQLQKVKILITYFDEVHLQHVYRLENSDANQMAQIASGIRIPEWQSEKLIKVQKRFLPFSIERDNNDFDIMEINLVDDWRVPIRKFLENPKEKIDRNIKQRAINYVIVGNDLFRKSSDEVLLLCIDKSQAMTVMGEVHEGTCGSHQSGEKMKWLLKRYGYYWPTIRKDCISYAKGCQKCQQYGPIQRVPAFPLQSIVKPWPFRGWAIDMIGEIVPHSSQQHEYVMVATDYFTKWTEAIPLKNVAQKQVIDFIEEHIFCRFGIPETITVNQASVFNGHEVMTYVNSYGVKILNSSPYYAQANGQVESTNKIIKNTLSKMIIDNPRDWHNLLSRVLWAYRTSKRESTRATPYELVYGQAAVLPVEVNIISHRVAKHYSPNNMDFEEAMYQELDGLEESRIDALNNIQAQKRNLERVYNKRVHEKSFAEGDLVWKAILPLDKKKKGYFGKWSPNWEGPFRVLKVLRGGAYQLESILGNVHERTINGKYLKAYFPSPWELIDE